MGGLIPLMLQPSASIAMARPYEPRVSRYTSTSSPVVRRLPKRNMALPRISRPEISYSGDERRVALDEVRVFYLKRQYKQCSTRAIHVLEDSRGLVHPLHTVYLSFYAAISLELTARPLHQSSPQKLALLQEARTYYQKAEFYISQASLEKYQPKILPAPSSHSSSSVSVIISIGPSVHLRSPSASSNASTRSTNSADSSRCSSSDSVFSHAHLQSRQPTVQSPALSVSSVDSSHDESSSCKSITPTNLIFKPRPVRLKKKVGFSPSLPILVSLSNLHSPILTDEAVSTSSSPISARSFQFTPSRSSNAPPIARSLSWTPGSPLAAKSSSACTTLSLPNTPTSISGSGLQSPGSSMSNFLLPRSIARYQSHLSTLRPRIQHHISEVDKLLLDLTAPPLRPPHETDSEMQAQLAIILPTPPPLTLSADITSPTSHIPTRSADLPPLFSDILRSRGLSFSSNSSEEFTFTSSLTSSFDSTFDSSSDEEAGGVFGYRTRPSSKSPSRRASKHASKQSCNSTPTPKRVSTPVPCKSSHPQKAPPTSARTLHFSSPNRQRWDQEIASSSCSSSTRTTTPTPTPQLVNPTIPPSSSSSSSPFAQTSQTSQSEALALTIRRAKILRLRERGEKWKRWDGWGGRVERVCGEALQEINANGTDSGML